MDLGIPIFIGTVVLGFVAGRVAERRHYRSIRAREKAFLPIPTITAKTLSDGRPVEEAKLVCGSVVVSVDYFKRLMATLRMLVGGELAGYSPLIDRGRREALLRMKESAPDAHLYLNCRLETSSLYKGKDKSIGSVEVMAYATAIRFAPTPDRG